MVKDIDPKLKSLCSYLGLGEKEIFSIPEYQRKYSWTIDQCDKLWQDIERFISTNGDDPYFFGTIIADCSQTGKLNLIDGQQRTITFILLLKALLIKIIEKLKKIVENDETASLKSGLEGRRNTIIKILYKIDDDDMPAFIKNSKPFVKTIIESKSINELYKNEIQIILEADTFEQAEIKVFKVPRKQKENRYTSFFKNFKFFYEKINEMGETQINEFAKILLRKCQVIEIRSWNVEQAIVMFNSLNSTGLPLADADIISADLYSKFNDDDKRQEFIESWQSMISTAENFKLKKVTSIDEILYQYMYIKRALANEKETTMPSMRSYFKDLHPEFLNEPQNFVDDILQIIDLWQQNETNDIVILRSIMSKFNNNFKLFYIPYLFIKKDDNKKLKIEFGNVLLKLFILLEIVELSYSSKNFKQFLFTVNMDNGQNKATSDIIKDIYNHINNNFDKEEIKELMRDNFANGSLVIINEVLVANFKNFDFDFLVQKNINIEHIMPQSGRNLQVVRTDSKMDLEEFKIYVNKIGNKILLEESTNKSIGRDWFVSKKDKYAESIFPLAKEIADSNKNEWTKSDIDTNTELAIERICNYIFSDDILLTPFIKQELKIEDKK